MAKFPITCFEHKGEWDVKLEQTSRTEFRVTYGLQIQEGLGYTAACSALGSAIMHSAACQGLLDNGAWN